MIKPPVPDPKRSVLRACVEATAQFSSVTAALVRIYQTTHPSQFEHEVVEWRENVSRASTDHEERLNRLESTYHPKLVLTELACAMAVWLVQSSSKGLSEPVQFDSNQIRFAEHSKRQLEDAAAELEMYGLVSLAGAVGRPVLLLRPKYELFALFDPVVMETSPQDDAVEIARLALELDSGHVPELERHLGWTKRRLNPALALVVGLVADGRIRKGIQPDYVTLGFVMSAEERVRFRRLVDGAASGKSN